MSQVLGIVYQMISAALIKKAGLGRKNAESGAVTRIQRFGDVLNLNVYFHMLFIDAVHSRNQYARMLFHRTKARTKMN